MQQSRLDISALFRPLFQGIASDRPECLVRVESKVMYLALPLLQVCMRNKLHS